ncbi:AarF/ABC1/UbiB kinase family protein [Neisseria leonii]|uniref:ABC1 kinase family protein n=1 Tax=Neisseria leonii TaxID=2995413 RepID=UPI00237C2E11|nr:AarF/UbiB family protein [Neisseria sp. 3986]MDD9326283.1 AarF/UbiB family protein [Neisseria sp. 3986]
MMIPTLLALRDFSRMREIVAVLSKYGLGEFVRRIKLAGSPSDAADEAGNRYLSTPRRFRLAFEELGPTFIKLGQILSTRVDIFNAEWIEEFERLQSNVSPIDGAEIPAVMAAALGRDPEEVFLSIDSRPIGSASIAQVHRAVLHSGQTVAVKIKRPDIDKLIHADLRILNHLAALIESEIPESRRYRPVQMMQYFARSLARETDLSVEIRYMQRFASAFSGHGAVCIPKVYAEYSGRRMVVQEYIADTLLAHTDISALPAGRRTEWAHTLTDTLFTMILEHGFFHADPHPGNIFIGENGRITLIDYGLVGHLSAERRREITDLIQALIARDAAAIQYVLSNWAQGDLPDESLLGADVLEMLLNYEHTPVRDLRISQVINDITHLMREHRLTLPGDLVMLFKALITLEGVVKQLDGGTELFARAKPIVLAQLRRRASPHEWLGKTRSRRFLLRRAVSDLPHNLLQLSRRIQSGRFSVNLDVKRIDDLNHQLDRTANRLTMGIVTAALIIGSSIVMSTGNGRLLGLLGYLLAFANSLWIIWSIWRSGKH